MEITILIFLFGGLFLGWSLGANDAANVFGTAVGTRMVSFTSAAIICSVFVILGAIISGAGTTETLGKLGSINALPGAFAACVAAGISVYLMTKVGLPVSTTQAIVGAIVGWNLYTGSSTTVSYTHLRAHETVGNLVCRLLLDHKYDQSSLQNIEDAFFDLEVIQNQKFFLQEN